MKRRRVKRLLAMLLAVCMLSGLVVTPAYAAGPGEAEESAATDSVAKEDAQPKEEPLEGDEDRANDVQAGGNDKSTQKGQESRKEPSMEEQETGGGERALVGAQEAEEARTYSPQARGVIGGFFGDMAKDIINNVIEMGMEDINEITEDPVTEFFVTLLGGAVGRELLNIEAEIQETQEMIEDLDQTVNAFYADTMAALDNIQTSIDKNDYNNRVARVNEAYALVRDTLLPDYRYIISLCVDSGGQVKEDLTEADSKAIKGAIEELMQDIRSQDLAGKLNNISSTADAAAGSTVYDAAFAISKDVHAFRHGTYMDMHDLFNYVTNTRLMLLYFMKLGEIEKEYKEAASQNGGVVPEDFEPQLAQFLSENGTFGVTISHINKEAESVTPFAEIAGAIGADIAWDEQQSGEDYYAGSRQEIKDRIYDSTLDQIEVYRPDIDFKEGYQGEKKVTEPAFKVVSNVNDQAFYISKQGGKMTDYLFAEDNFIVDLYYYPVHYGAACTTDGRYILPATKEALDPLLSRDKGNNPLNFLESELRKDNENVLGAAKIILTTQTVPVWDDETEMRYVFLLDSQKYGTVGDASEYMRDGSGNPLTTRDISKGATYKFGDGREAVVRDAQVLRIYADQQASGMNETSGGDGTTTYTPSTAGSIPNRLALSDGDILDLSGLAAEQDQKVYCDSIISVSGNVTIIGDKSKTYQGISVALCEGAHLTMQDLKLAMYGDSTLQNLDATNTSPFVVLAAGSDVSIKIKGECALRKGEMDDSDGYYDHPIYAGKYCNTLTIKGEDKSTDSLYVEHYGWQQKDKMLNSSSITVENALIVEHLSLSINSGSDADPAAYTVHHIRGGEGSAIRSSSITSKVTYGVPTASLDNTGEIHLKKGEIRDSTLNLASGDVSGDVVLFNNEWTGRMAVRLKLQTGSQPEAETDERIDISFGQSNWVYDLGGLFGGNQFENGQLDILDLSVPACDFDSLTVQNEGEDGWYLETLEAITSKSGDIRTQRGYVYPFYEWVETESSVHKNKVTASQNDAALTYTIKTADSDKAGTESTIYSYISYVDGGGSDKRSEEFNLKERLTNSEQSLEKNTTNTVTVPLRNGKGIREIYGVYIASDHAGPDAGWKMGSIKLSVEGKTAEVNNANQWFLSNSYVEDKFSLFGPDAYTSGACRIVTKTADKKDAGSDSEMKIRIHSKENDSWTNWITFSEFHDNGADPIERGRLDSFNVTYDKDIQTIDKIQFSSDGSGTGPTWECSYIEITPWGYRSGDGTKYHFEINAKMKEGTWTYTPSSRSATVGTVHGSSQYDTQKLQELLEELKAQGSASSLYVSSKEKGILANAFLKKLAEDQGQKGRTLVFGHEDENGNILYQWIFDGSAVGDFDRDVDLGVAITPDNLGAFGIAKTDGTVVLNFSHSKELPENTRLRIAATTYGFAPGDQLHFYYYNPESKELEELFFEGGITVGEDGYVEVGITHCSDYVLSKYGKEELTAKGSSGSSQQTGANAPAVKDGTAAKTRDANNLMPMLVLACAALAAASAVLYRKKKK